MRVNGKDMALDAPCSLQAFLEKEGYNTERVVVERNREIIVREKFSETMLSDEDRLEIVHFVGGG